MSRPKPVHQLTAAQFDALFKTEDDCIVYLVARRWPQGVAMPPLRERQCLCARFRPPLAMHGVRSGRLHRLSVLALDRHNL